MLTATRSQKHIFTSTHTRDRNSSFTKQHYRERIWYFLFYSILFHCLKNASLDLLNGFHNPLLGHALWSEKTQNSIIPEVPPSSRIQ